MYASFNARACGLTLTAGETIKLADVCGFEGVDLMVRDIVVAGESIPDIKAQLNDCALHAGAFPMPVHWRGDEAIFKRDLEAFKPLADVAAHLGLLRTGTWVCPEIPERLAGPGEFERCVDFHLERLGAIAHVLGQRCIQLGLEIIGPETSRTGKNRRFMTKLKDLAPLLNPLIESHSHVGILFDTFHQYAANESLDDALSWGIDRVVWTHLADLPANASPDRSQIEDALRGLPGDHGAVQNKAILKRLSDNGYTGPVTVEPLARCSTLSGKSHYETARAVADSLCRIWPVPL